MPIQINKKTMIALAVIIVLIGAAVLGYFYNKKQKAGEVQAMAEKAIKFVNENLLAGGTAAILEGATDMGDVVRISLKIGEQVYTSYATKDGKLFFPEGYEVVEKATSSQSSATVGNFMVKDEPICMENGKPIVYFFGSNTCPHCQWEHPILEKVMKSFENLISFHNNMDANTDMEVFSKYSDGGIPTMVFGCKYYKLGSGESDGEEQETKNLTAMLCKLTNSQPSEVCAGVQELVSQIQ